jgi:dTDP-4-dehydrorhamnose reductase
MIISVFGSTGMLGRYVVKYLQHSTSHEIRPLTRLDLDITSYAEFNNADKIAKESDVIINCAGIIKPMVRDMDYARVFMGNSIFPKYLAQACHENNCHLYHISTDCVFSGKLEFPLSYNEFNDCDVKDDPYGYSKFLGETGATIRTSIVGEEVAYYRSLLEWAKARAGGSIQGYTNHIWNGVTCLELAKKLEMLISNNIWWHGTRILYSNERVTKLELLQHISDVFELNLKIAPHEAEPCNRSLSSIYGDEEDCSYLGVKKSIRQQLEEMRDFHDILYG